MAVLVKGRKYMAERGTFLQGSVKIDGDFLMAHRCTIWGNLVVTGNLYLCPECQINGNVLCTGGVIGRSSAINGTVTATEGPLIVCDGAKIREINCKGDVSLRPEVSSESVTGVNILVLGKVHCGKLMGKNTRVISPSA